MSKRFILTIGREFGSGGKHIGRAVAKELGIEIYDRNIIEKVAAELDIDAEHLAKFEEKKKCHLFHRTVKGHSTSMEDHVAQHQFDYMKKLADSEESFIVVGRCAEWVLKDYEGVISVFITGDREYKIGRVMKQFGLDRKAAIEKMDRHDRTRRAYHNHHCNFKWGDSRHYDLIVNSALLGTEGTATMIANFVKEATK